MLFEGYEIAKRTDGATGIAAWAVEEAGDLEPQKRVAAHPACTPMGFDFIIFSQGRPS